MDPNKTHQPESSIWPLIRAQVIEKYGKTPIAHELADGSIVRSDGESVFGACAELDALGNDNPQLVLKIIQAGIARAREL